MVGEARSYERGYLPEGQPKGERNRNSVAAAVRRWTRATLLRARLPSRGTAERRAAIYRRVTVSIKGPSPLGRMNEDESRATLEHPSGTPRPLARNPAINRRATLRSPCRDSRRSRDKLILSVSAGACFRRGYPTWIRTMNNASKGRCVTVTPSGKRWGIFRFEGAMSNISGLADWTTQWYHGFLDALPRGRRSTVPWSSG